HGDTNPEGDLAGRHGGHGLTTFRSARLNCLLACWRATRRPRAPGPRDAALSVPSTLRSLYSAFIGPPGGSRGSRGRTGRGAGPCSRGPARGPGRRRRRRRRHRPAGPGQRGRSGSSRGVLLGVDGFVLARDDPQVVGVPGVALGVLAGGPDPLQLPVRRHDGALDVVQLAEQVHVDAAGLDDYLDVLAVERAEVAGVDADIAGLEPGGE